MQINFKRGAHVVATPTRGGKFHGVVVRRYDTSRGMFVVVRELRTKREVNMRPALLKLA